MNINNIYILNSIFTRYYKYISNTHHEDNSRTPDSVLTHSPNIMSNSSHRFRDIIYQICRS